MRKKNYLDKENGLSNKDNSTFFQIEEFLETHTIQTSKDIMTYFSNLIDFGNQFIEKFFAGEEGNNDLLAKGENSDEENELSQGDIQELVKFLLQSLYAFEDNNFQWQLNYESIAREEKVKEEDIYILNNSYY